MGVSDFVCLGSRQCCGSGFGSVIIFSDLDLDPDPYINKQKARKTLICFLVVHFYVSMKTELNVPSKSNKQNIFEKNSFFISILSATEREKQDPDPDPFQNSMDPQLWL